MLHARRVLASVDKVGAQRALGHDLALFVDLALSDYGGPIVLTPSAPSEIPRWRDWLSSRKIAGCGSKAAAEHEVQPEVSLEQQEKLLHEQQAGAGDDATPAVGAENNEAEGSAPEADANKEG